MDRIADLQAAHLQQLAALPTAAPRSGQARRMLEKYRVQLWAQQLGTAQTVGDARIRKMLSP
jgi:ATP-dependent helicase HrpA